MSVKFLAVVLLGASLAPIARASSRHFVLVHGGGPEFIVTLKPLAKALRRRGVAANQIAYLHYDYRGSLDEINRELVPQWPAALSAEAPNVVITHSLGDVVALRSLFESGRSHRVEKFIALGGVAHGQDEDPRPCTEGPWCPAYIRALTPFPSPYTENLWRTWAEPLALLSHCAIYSIDDRNVDRPVDSGVFPHGADVSLAGISHLGLIRSERVVDAIFDECLPAPLRSLPISTN